MPRILRTHADPNAGRRRPLPWWSRSRVGSTIAVALAVAVAIVGLSDVVGLLRSRPGVTPLLAATLEGLTVEVDSAGWLEMNHAAAPPVGFQMPPAMMPGMPSGDDHRFAVKIVVQNGSDGTRVMRAPTEFTLRTAAGRHWTAVANTFGDLPRLGKGTAVSGSLYFDLPPDELVGSPFWLEWEHSGQHQALALPVEGAAQPHTH